MPAATGESGSADGPRWFAVLHDGRVRWHDSHTGRPIGDEVATSDVVVTSIASWPGDHTVLEAVQNNLATRCVSSLQLQTITSASSLTLQTLPGLPAAPGAIGSMVVSRDQRMLALAVDVTYAHHGRCGTGRTQTQLWVVDLKSGQHRIWTLPATSPTRPGQIPQGESLDNLTFAPDGQHLALTISACCASSGVPLVLGIGAPTGALLPRLQQVPVPGGACPGPPFLWLRQGLLNADCNTSTWTFTDPATGNALGTLAAASGAAADISVDASGQHYLAYIGQQVVRIDNGQVTTVMSLPWDLNGPPSIAW